MARIPARHGETPVNILSALKASDARASVRAAIGDVEDDGRGFSVSLNYVHKGNGECPRPALLFSAGPPFDAGLRRGVVACALAPFLGTLFCRQPQHRTD